MINSELHSLSNASPLTRMYTPCIGCEGGKKEGRDDSGRIVRLEDRGGVGRKM